MAKKVTTIPATRNRFTSEPVYAPQKRRVAGYARVSTDLVEQQTSYENQVEYYTRYIKSRSDWTFVGMYTDEGISATNTNHREGFKKMIDDALAGKIDLIITKSVSRFARNTVDSLTTVRNLKEKGVEIFFEKENIWTLDSKGELLITIMSSLAQEESRSISENTTWGKRKAFANGKASVAYSHFLGYDAGFVINEEEAKTVRLIFKLFLMGFSYYGIKKELEKRGRKTASGKSKWQSSSIQRILTNEKYKGDALLQKEYTVDFLQKTRKKNTGEVPQYYVEGHHVPIIEPAVFDMVQAELMKRREQYRRFFKTHIFSTMIKCGECGGWYGSKIWHSNDKYRRVVYRCNDKYEHKSGCKTPHLTEDDIKRVFTLAINQLLGVKKETIKNLKVLRDMAANTDKLVKEREKAIKDVSRFEEELHILVEQNARMALDQKEYDKKYREAYDRYESGITKVDEATRRLTEGKARWQKIDVLIEAIGGLGKEVPGFDEQLWNSIVDKMTVFTRDRIVVTFIGDYEVTVKLE